MRLIRSPRSSAMRLQESPGQRRAERSALSRCVDNYKLEPYPEINAFHYDCLLEQSEPGFPFSILIHGRTDTWGFAKREGRARV